MNAHAKINLALVVGPTRPDGKHEVSTVLQRIELADRIELEPAEQLRVDGFDGDTLVRGALERLAGAAGVDPLWAVLIETLDEPLSQEALHVLAAELGADVPFFLHEGPQLGEGDGSDLTPLDLPQPYTVLLIIPNGEPKESTRAVYAAFDERRGADGYEHRREQLLAALSAGDVASFPPNDLGSSPLANELRALGAFRADVSGAGPAVYGLFHDPSQAEAAGTRTEDHGRVWVGGPAW